MCIPRSRFCAEARACNWTANCSFISLIIAIALCNSLANAATLGSCSSSCKITRAAGGGAAADDDDELDEAAADCF